MISVDYNYSGIIAGVDEAGRGPLAGPVVASAVIINQNSCQLSEILSEIDDSKKLSKKRREKLYPIICNTCDVGIGIVDVNCIDNINILQASLLAMKMAVEDLSLLPNIALIDGNKAPDLLCRTETIVKGDSKSISIAAASIVAKVTRDKIMTDMHKNFPQYGWDRNAGYGTKEHLESIRTFGITIHHRKSFAPIKKFIF